MLSPVFASLMPQRNNFLYKIKTFSHNPSIIQIQYLMFIHLGFYKENLLGLLTN